MIQKIKDMMQLREAIDKLSNRVDGLEFSVSASSKMLLELSKELETTCNENRSMIKAMQEDRKAIADFRETLKNEIYEFKLFRKDMRKELVDKSVKEIKSLKETLGRDVNDFNNTKKKLDTKLTQVEELSLEIAKLREIAKGISKQDYELVKFTKELKNKEKEKIELMRKIDSLERLVAKYRRR